MAAPRSHTVRHRVAFGETDAAGVVFYPNYLRWFDQGTHELFRSLELPLGTVHASFGVILPVVSVRADFRAPLHYDDEIDVHSEVGAVSERSVTIGHRVVHGQTESCIGTEVRGCVAAENGRFVARSIPEDLRRRLA